MKKCISAFLVSIIMLCLFSTASLSASAVERAQTNFDVKTGSDITYVLKLGGVDNPIIGCMFSIYYDSSVLELQSVADFTNSTDDGDWECMLNPNTDGEVRGNWSLLRGVDFSTERNFITLNFKSKSTETTTITYFINYMYDDNIFSSADKPQITKYVFSCDITVDGNLVVDDAPPALNTEEEQEQGTFINSVTGDSKDADKDIPGTVGRAAKSSGNASRSAISSSGSSGSNDGSDSGNSNDRNGSQGAASGTSGASSASSSDKTKTASKNSNSTESTAHESTVPGSEIASTASTKDSVATSDEATRDEIATPTEASGSGGVSPIVWISIPVVLGGAGTGVFFWRKKKLGL